MEASVAVWLAGTMCDDISNTHHFCQDKLVAVLLGEPIQLSTNSSGAILHPDEAIVLVVRLPLKQSYAFYKPSQLLRTYGIRRRHRWFVGPKGFRALNCMRSCTNMHAWRYARVHVHICVYVKRLLEEAVSSLHPKEEKGFSFDKRRSRVVVRM